MIYPWLVLAKNRSRWQRKQVEFLILSMPELVSLSLKYPCPDVEAAPKHRIAEAHPHHRDNQNQLPRESKYRLMIKTFLKEGFKNKKKIREFSLSPRPPPPPQ